MRHCFIRPGDDFHETSTRILGINKAIEISNMPQSLVTKEFFEAVCTMRFFENDPPKGVIEGDVTDDKSIRMLSEEERNKLKEEERKAILTHQENIKHKVLELQKSPTSPSQQ